MVGTTPFHWRAGQLLLIVALISLLAAATGSVLFGISVSVFCVRVGARVVLRQRRHRRDRALQEAAPALARRLAAELGRGAGCGAALGAVAAGSLCRDHPVLASALAVAANEASLGRPAPEALASALGSEMRSRGSGRDAVCRVVSLVALAQRSGSGSAPLLRLAAVLDDDRRTGDHARAITAEPRMGAAVLPVLALAALAMVCWSNPSVLAAALTGAELMVMAACAVVVSAGVLAVRRITMA